MLWKGVGGKDIDVHRTHLRSFIVGAITASLTSAVGMIVGLTITYQPIVPAVIGGTASVMYGIVDRLVPRDSSAK